MYVCRGQRHRAQALAQGILPSSQLPSSNGATSDDEPPAAASSRPASEPLQPPPPLQMQPFSTPLATPLPSPCAQAAHQNAPSSAPSSEPNSPESDGHTASEEDSTAGARSTQSRARSGDHRSMPRRGLRFDVEDDEPDATSSSQVNYVDSGPKRRPLSRLPSAGLPPIHRAPSLKVTHQHSQQQQHHNADVKGEGHSESDGERMLPEGITAIEVADPDNPNSLVLQVTCLCCALPLVDSLPARLMFDQVNSVALLTQPCNVILEQAVEATPVVISVHCVLATCTPVNPVMLLCQDSKLQLTGVYRDMTRL